MKLSQKIRHIRELRGFTQEYMGTKLGMSQQNYSKIENEGTIIDEKTIERIALVLGIEKETLLGFDINFIFNNNNQQGGKFRLLIPSTMTLQLRCWNSLKQ